MDVSSLLTDSKSHPSTTKPPRGTAPTGAMYQQPSYIKKEESRDTKSTMIKSEYQDGHSGSMSGNMAHSRNNSTVKGGSALAPKNVTFQYILTEDKQARARLPMRVNIYPHDETNSIITTVKNFYGIYDGSGVAFEDQDGNTLIARYENLEDKHTVYVRVLEGIESKSTTPAVGMSPSRPRLAPPFELAPAGANISRPSSRTARYRSTSPAMKRFQRGQSVSSFSKSRGKSSNKGRTGSTQGSVADTIMRDDASDSDEGASVTSSRRAKVDAVASAEISVENIVEGGRRKRARFDSSELPLFQPSQIPMPASVSSLSPQRRVGSQAAASPFQHANSYTFSYNALPSPQSHHQSDMYMHHNTSAVSLNSGSYGGARRLGAHHPARHSYPSANGVLPTPDPTIGSVISDEDVARQLMALGDPSNFGSLRASTSTIDDTLSGKAEVASSAGGSDGSEVDDRELPERAGHSDYESEEEYEDRNDASFKGESDGFMPGSADRRHGSITSAHNGHANLASIKSNKPPKPRVNTQPKKKSSGSSHKASNAPMSPTSLPPHSRKPSISHQPLAADEEDLSSKPRCQRCRKSKKGCDRQRPCGRCRDAGIGADGCISEDEGNGRKGRYGRHMGVTVKKFEHEGPAPATPSSASHMQQAPIQQAAVVGGHHGHGHSHNHGGHAMPAANKLGPIAMSPPQHHHHQQAYPHSHVQQWQQPQHHAQPMHMHPYHQMFPPPTGAMAAPNFLPDKKGQKRKR